MKQLILLSTALGLLALGAVAQQPDAAQVIVHYQFTHVRDTNNRAHPYTQEMVLIIGKKSSGYHRRPVGPQRGPGTTYYQFVSEKKMMRVDYLFNTYLIPEAWPIIDWRISGDTASVGGLHCQKATAHFKGRDYTAWFCPGLPLHAGPWKLNGLPGVIVEAYDTRKEVQFTFAGVEKPTGSDAELSEIKLPTDAIKITEAEFTRLQEVARKDPAAFSKALTVQNGGVPGKSGPQIDIKPGGPGPVINNPLELPEKR